MPANPRNRQLVINPRRKSSQRESSAQLQDTVRLSADGLSKVLGNLEARGMRAVWSIGEPAPVRLIHAEVVREHVVAVLTVTTVLNKLTAKKLLRRRRRADLLHYEARLSEQEFLAQASRRVMEGVVSLAPEAMASSFVDVLAERDPAQLAELARLIRRRLEGRRKQ